MSAASSRARVSIVVAASVLALVLTGCSKAGSTGTTSPSTTPLARPSSTAQLEILSPTNGEVIHGSSVTLRVKLTGARIVPATTTHIVPDQGHLHVFIDNQLAGMNFKLDDVLTNVSVGTHILRVEFVASDHIPFDPRVFVQVTFEVQP